MWAAACAVCVLAAGPASASDLSDVKAVIQKWVADLDKGDIKAFVAACEPRAGVIDGFPPYAWGSCADWMSAYDANNKRIQATPGVVSIGRPLYTELTGGRAYMIYPATFTDVQNGKTAVYKGTWTMTLHKARGGWTFTGSSANWGGNYTVRSGG
jgi:hypothetical protein